MKNALIRFAATGLLASGILLAETPAPAAPAQPPVQQRRWHRGHVFDRLAEKLNLTEAQRTQAKSIWQSARESSRPLAQQLRQAHVALRDAAKAGKTSAEIDQLAANAGHISGQLTAVRAKAFERLYALLTPEQRTTADQLGRHFRGMFMGGHEHAPASGASY